MEDEKWLVLFREAEKHGLIQSSKWSWECECVFGRIGEISFTTVECYHAHIIWLSNILDQKRIFRLHKIFAWRSLSIYSNTYVGTNLNLRVWCIMQCILLSPQTTIYSDQLLSVGKCFRNCKNYEKVVIIRIS